MKNKMAFKDQEIHNERQISEWSELVIFSLPLDHRSL